MAEENHLPTGVVVSDFARVVPEGWRTRSREADLPSTSSLCSVPGPLLSCLLSTASVSPRCWKRPCTQNLTHLPPAKPACSSWVLSPQPWNILHLVVQARNQVFPKPFPACSRPSSQLPDLLVLPPACLDCASASPLGWIPIKSVDLKPLVRGTAREFPRTNEQDIFLLERSLT